MYCPRKCLFENLISKSSVAADETEPPTSERDATRTIRHGDVDYNSIMARTDTLVSPTRSLTDDAN